MLCRVLWLYSYTSIFFFFWGFSQLSYTSFTEIKLNDIVVWHWNWLSSISRKGYIDGQMQGGGLFLCNFFFFNFVCKTCELVLAPPYSRWFSILLPYMCVWICSWLDIHQGMLDLLWTSPYLLCTESMQWENSLCITWPSFPYLYKQGLDSFHASSLTTPLIPNDYPHYP